MARQTQHHAAASTAARCRGELIVSLHAAEQRESPFRHWRLRDLLPPALAGDLEALPFAAPPMGRESGTREAQNDSRRYFDAAAVAAFPVCRAVAEAFQHPQTVAAIERVTGAALGGGRLRIELAQDRDGFWLAPHTDIRVKQFTLQCYLGPAGQPELGTDLYADRQTWACRAPFAPGSALAFVPSDRSWHGFEPRPIAGVRRSLIVNYVTEAWRAREQLAFPDVPVGRGAG